MYRTQNMNKLNNNHMHDHKTHTPLLYHTSLGKKKKHDIISSQKNNKYS